MWFDNVDLLSTKTIHNQVFFKKKDQFSVELFRYNYDYVNMLLNKRVDICRVAGCYSVLQQFLKS